MAYGGHSLYYIFNQWFLVSIISKVVNKPA